MINYTERREVARRLRKIRPCKSGHIKWWEIARALGLKQPAGWFGWEKFEPDSANRLADLIDPGDMSQGRRDIVACDREALLALADECDEMRDNGCSIGSYELYRIARRIREACGEEVRNG